MFTFLLIFCSAGLLKLLLLFFSFSFRILLQFVQFFLKLLIRKKKYLRKFYIKFSKDQISICGLGLNRLFCCFGKKASEVLTMTTSNTRKLFIFYTRVKKTDVLITFHFTSFHILLLLLTFLFHVLYWKNERERGFYTTITFYCLAF